MKKKLISLLTVATLLVTSLATVAFADNGPAWKNSGDDKKVEVKSQDKDKSVTDSVYEDDDDKGKDRDEHGDKGKPDEGTIKNVTVALYTYGQEDPAAVIDSLLNNNVKMSKIMRVINQISNDESGKYSDLPAGALEAYSAAIQAKLANVQVELQEKIDALTELTDLYDKIGDLEKAINIQKKAIMADYKNILSYKKIGQVFNKKGDKDIKVFTVGEQVYFDVQPVIESDRTLVPIRAIAESLKSDVQWDEATQTITITKDGNVVKLVLGSDTAIINDQEVKLDVPAKTLNDRTLVPVRFVSEALNKTVDWEPEGQIVIIY